MVSKKDWETELTVYVVKPRNRKTPSRERATRGQAEKVWGKKSKNQRGEELSGGRRTREEEEPGVAEPRESRVGDPFPKLQKENRVVTHQLIRTLGLAVPAGKKHRGGSKGDKYKRKNATKSRSDPSRRLMCGRKTVK